MHNSTTTPKTVVVTTVFQTDLLRVRGADRLLAPKKYIHKETERQSDRKTETERATSVAQACMRSTTDER